MDYFFDLHCICYCRKDDSVFANLDVDISATDLLQYMPSALFCVELCDSDSQKERFAR